MRAQREWKKRNVEDSRERVADARRTSLDAPRPFLLSFSNVFVFFFLPFHCSPRNSVSFLSTKPNHRLAEALEDDGGAGGQGGGQGNDGYDDGGKGGVSFFLPSFFSAFSRVAASFFG